MGSVLFLTFLREKASLTRGEREREREREKVDLRGPP
jgi:hypothetical protein